MQSFYVKSPLTEYDWTITPDTATIAGMHCRKTTTTTANSTYVEVWFTDEIPISNSPAEFHGLPGLILKVETRNVSVIAEKVNFIHDVEIKKWKNCKLVTEEELVNRVTETFKSINSTQGDS